MAYAPTKWNLGDLYPSFASPELQAAFDNVEEQVMSFEGIRGKLQPDLDANQFMEFVRASEETVRIINKIYAFTGLSFASDTQDQTAQTYTARVQQFAAQMQNRILFFSLWWKELDDRNAERPAPGAAARGGPALRHDDGRHGNADAQPDHALIDQMLPRPWRRRWWFLRRTSGGRHVV